MVAFEQRRLSAIFRRSLLVAAAAGGLACSTKSADSPAGDAGTAGADAATGDSGGSGVDANVPPDPCSATKYTPNPPDSCGDFVRFPCGLPSAIVPRADCFFNLNDCASICPDVHFNCHAADGYCQDGGAITPDDAGAIIVDCTTCNNGAGRAPAGLAPATASAPSALGAYFAAVAHLEAASVYAFRAMQSELAALGAPAELVRAAREAERDEVRHARATARLARRFGGRYVRPRVTRPAARSLETIAVENAVEGCVRETFGALVATWQAGNAEDAAVARTFAGIADDETRHAALSWAVLRWSLSELDAEARARVVSAFDAAARELVDAPSPCDSVGLLAAAGLPSREARRALAEALRAELSAGDLAAAA